MRFGLGVVLGVGLLASCGQAVRSSSKPSGGGESSAQGGATAENGGSGTIAAAGAPSTTSGGAGASPNGGNAAVGGRAGNEPALGGQSPGRGGGEPSAGASGETHDEYLYCACSSCSRSLVVDDITCYFPDVVGDLESIKAAEAAERAQEPCDGGIGVPYRACVSPTPDSEPTASYSSMPYVGGINRVYITKRDGDFCTRLELSNERQPLRLRTAIETSSALKVTSAVHAPCSGQTEHWMIGVSGSLSARGTREHCELDLHVTAFFVDRKTGQEPVSVRFDFDDMDLGEVPITCP